MNNWNRISLPHSVLSISNFDNNPSTHSSIGVPHSCQGLCCERGKEIPTINGSCCEKLHTLDPTGTVKTTSQILLNCFCQWEVIRPRNNHNMFRGRTFMFGLAKESHSNISSCRRRGPHKSSHALSFLKPAFGFQPLIIPKGPEP